MTRLYLATLPTGQRVLVTLFDDATAELAFREGDRWGVPTPLEVAPGSESAPVLDRETLIDRIAQYRYESFDSHFSMPGGFSWEAYKEADPSAAAALYLTEAREAVEFAERATR